MGDDNNTNYGIENFDQNGFAGPISILSIEDANKALTQVMSRNEPLKGNDRFKVHLFLSEMSRIVYHPTLIQTVRQVLHTHHIALWSSDLNIKQPNSRQYFSSHQDATYTGLHPADQCVTVWVALSDPVGINEGCLSFVKGSHKQGQLEHAQEETSNNSNNKNDDNNNMLSRGQRVLWEPQDNDDDWVTIPLRAGQATVHHFYTIHRSGHNQHPTQPRVGLALRYMTANVRQTGPVREFISWIDDDHHDDSNYGDNNTNNTSSDSSKEENEQKRQEMEQWFDLEPKLPVNPSEDDIQAGRQAHEEAMRREASNYFHDCTDVKAYDQVS